MQLIPAIDLLDGQVVRLAQGDYTRRTQFDTDPAALAQIFAEAGASWLHMVDLNAAKDGGEANLPVIERVCRQAGLNVQTGGGVRSRADIRRRLDAGARRVVVGSVCVRTPETVRGWLEEYGAGKLAVALDVKKNPDGRWLPQAAGWREAGQYDLWGLLEFLAGNSMPPSQPPPRVGGGELEGGHLLCTDISRDGMLSGPNTALYAEIMARYPKLQLQASGGIGAAQHLAAVAATGAAACIVGRALLEGKINSSEITRWSQ